MLTRTLRPHTVRSVAVVPVVHQCLVCGRFSHPVVQFEERCAPIVAQLADNCPRCGTSIDTPETIADLIDAATLLRAPRYCGRCEGTGWYGDPQVPCDECRPRGAA